MGGCLPNKKTDNKNSGLNLQKNSNNKNINTSKASNFLSSIENNEKNLDIQKDKNTNSKDRILSAREIVRFNPKFEQPIEEMDKETAYLQFLYINSYYDKNKNKIFPEGYFNWKDPNLVSKLESEIKKYNDNAELMNGLVQSKAMHGFHPETMGIYVEYLKHDDYIYQLLNRQLLIYKKFYALLDDKTIEYIEYLKKEEDDKIRDLKESIEI